MPENIELAEQIVEARKQLDRLWEATDDLKAKKKIRRKINDLDLEMMRLISINIKKRGEEYTKATESLKAANDKIGEAIDDLDQLADALEAVATAIDFIIEVKPA